MNLIFKSSTGVAARNTNRKFIGIELDSDYFRIALERDYTMHFLLIPILWLMIGAIFSGGYTASCSLC